MDGCTDGSWKNEKDGRVYHFFKCPGGKGLYYPLNSLQLDARYTLAKTSSGNRKLLARTPIHDG